MSHIETRFTRKWLEKELSKRYFKKPYDRFMWWRSYTPKQKPLGTKATFRDKILNGEVDVELIDYNYHPTLKGKLNT